MSLVDLLILLSVREVGYERAKLNRHNCVALDTQQTK